MGDYDHVLSVQTDVQTLKDRAHMYRLMNLFGATAKADADYQAVLRIAPKDMDALLGHAYLSRESGNYDEALRAYTASISQKTSDPCLLVDRGRTFLLKGDSASANTDFAAATRLDSSSPCVRSLLGLVEKKKGVAPLSRSTTQAMPSHVIMGWLLLGRLDEYGRWTKDSPKDIYGIPPGAAKGESFTLANAAPLAAQPIASANAPTICTLRPGQSVEVSHSANLEDAKSGTFVWIEVGVEVSPGDCKE